MISSGGHRSGSVLETNLMVATDGAVTPKFAAIDASTNGDNTIVAAVSGKKIRVLVYSLVCTLATTVRWKSGGATNKSGPMAFAANGGISVPYCPVGHLETATTADLVLNLSAGNQVSGHLVYIEVSA